MLGTVRIITARGIIVVMVAVLCVGCAASASPLSGKGGDQALAVVTIPAGQDVFDPYIMPVQSGEPVTWHNADGVAHTLTTVPQQSNFLNPITFALTLAPGQTASVTLTRPGIYYYYDTTEGSWDVTAHRVLPNQGLPRYPMSMEGIIWVQGAIPGLPAHVANSVVHLHDQIAQFIVAVRTGGTVSWQNFDTDAHFFQTVLGWDAPINPVEVGIYNLLGEDAMPPLGQTRSLTFDKPGLYYYFCFTHATVDPVLLRVYARPIASEYPIAMDGFVLVTGA